MSTGPIDGIGGTAGLAPSASVDGAAPSEAATAIAPTAPAQVDALAAALDAGQITPEQALQQLLDERISADLAPADRAELRAMLTELAAEDPYLSGLLAGR